MHDSAFRSRRGWVLGALASATLLSACGVLPKEQEGQYVIPPGTPRTLEELGYHETIQGLPTSIDPRTPESMGTPGRSLQEDLGARALREQSQQEQQAIGGAGHEEPMKLGVPGEGVTGEREEPEQER